MTQANQFIPLNIAVLTISDSRNKSNDRSGRLLKERAEEAGHRVTGREIVKDDLYAIRSVISQWIASPHVNAILTTGGTGVTGRDGTPEAIKPLLDKEITGFGELFRVISFEEIRTSSLQSRAIAGVANATYIFCLPGSSGACRTGWDHLIKAQLDHRTQPCNLAMLMPRLHEA